MSEAARDGNRVPTLIGVSEDDLSTPTRVAVDPITGEVLVKPKTGYATSTKQDDIITELQVINSLVPSSYDYIGLTYTGDDPTTVVFKSGGSGGTTVATFTLAWSNSKLTSLTKT